MSSMTYREFFAKISQGIPQLTGNLGTRFVGVVHGLVSDIVAEGASQAVRAPWLTRDNQPPDALPLIGTERCMPRYPYETANATYQTRLLNAWDSYNVAGDETFILEHLAAAGWPNVEIGDPSTTHAWQTVPMLTRGQFQVYFDEPNPVTGGPKHWGDFHWGDGTMYGMQGDRGEIALIKKIIRRRKPAQWICVGLYFQVDASIIYIPFQVPGATTAASGYAAGVLPGLTGSATGTVA